MCVPRTDSTRAMVFFPASLREGRGFSLVELVVVLLVLSILAVTVGMRWDAPSSTIPYQAELVARHLRHAQMLAMNWGQTLQVSIASPTNYFVRCATASATPPCNGAGAVVDPSNNGATFDVVLSNGVTITGPVALNFDRLGRPVNPVSNALYAAANTYTLSTGSVTWSARVNPITGFVTVQSP